MQERKTKNREKGGIYKQQVMTFYISTLFYILPAALYANKGFDAGNICCKPRTL